MTEGEGPVKRLWTAQQRQFALWTPVMIGIGVWVRLGLSWSIPFWAVLLALGFGGAVSVHFRRSGSEFRTLTSAALVFVVIGVFAGSLRVMLVDAPVLESDFQGEVTGRVIATDRSRSGSPRVVLDGLSLAGVHSSAVPKRMRLTLIDADETLIIGSVISVIGTVGPPAGPAAPGAFDFSRQAFFRQIGGVGYVRGNVEIRQLPEGKSLWLQRVRSDISKELRAGITGEEGAVAAALIVGDRSHISDNVTNALRDSGLAHLLAISGLHIGLMSALTFWLVRFALALLPNFASRFPIRKIAALAGLGAAGGYLALAGFGVATQRAFIMSAVAFTAILLDRPAVTARGLAAAACIVLLFRPESLFEAGFQMSFAAVAVLIAGYEVTRGFWRRRAQLQAIHQRIFTGIIATMATSVMAGAATAPFAVYHFNRLVAYGLPANLFATPVMGLWIMPTIILTAVIAPFGFAGLGLALLGWGIGYVLCIADFVAGLEGAAGSIPAGSPTAFAAIIFAGLWLVIWRGPLRIVSILPFLVGVFLWRGIDQPDVLISEGARLVAARADNGSLWVSRERKSGYSAETWLRRNGEGNTSQSQAYKRRDWKCSRTHCLGVARFGKQIILFRNSSNRKVIEYCRNGAIVIVPKIFVSQELKTQCTVIDRAVLDSASSVSVTLASRSKALINVARATSLGDNQ